MELNYEDLKEKVEKEERANEARQQEMIDGISKFIKNVNGIEPADRQGKYRKALTDLWERTFLLIRWYVIDATQIKVCWIEADEKGRDFLKEILRDLTIRLDKEILQFFENGGEPMDLFSLADRMQESVSQKWMDYALSTKEDKKAHPLSRRVWEEVEKRPVPPAKL